MDRDVLMDPWFWARLGLIYFVVAVVAGAIAYLGNHMGRNIGKKRISILGLRPKHTSNLITAITGSLIAVSTLTLILLLSDEARRMIAGIDKLKGQLNSLQLEVRQVEAQLAELRSSRLVWNVHEPITQGTLDPGLPTATQRLRILTQLDYANTCSIQKNNQIARELHDPPLDAEQLLEWNEAQVDLLAEKMTHEDKVIGVRIVADRNILYRDKVPVNLELVPVTRIFREGEVVATQVLRSDSPELLLDWYAFVAAVRESALRRGMMEVNGSLGEGLTASDLDHLISELKKLPGPGQVSAVARWDLYETSRLAVRIQVTPASHTALNRSLASRSRDRSGTAKKRLHPSDIIRSR